MYSFEIYPCKCYIRKNTFQSVLHYFMRIFVKITEFYPKNVSENEIIEHLILVKRRFERNGEINLSKGYSLIKDTPEKAFRYADEMLYADKLSKKRRNCSAENI